MSNYFPVELFIQILLKLPIKTLLRCTCVSKSWFLLITNPHFIAMHAQSTSQDDHSVFLLIRYFFEACNRDRYLLCQDTPTSSHIQAVFELPFMSVNKFFRLVGSCHGLICLSDDFSSYMNNIVLWNPLIKKQLMLPSPQVTYPTHGEYRYVLGFGHDSYSNDYKVVRISYLHDKIRRKFKETPLVEVYSVNNNCWRFIVNASAPPVFLIKLDLNWSQVFVNGAIHWIGYQVVNGDIRDLILKFDLRHEVFGGMILPKSLACCDPQCLSIVLLEQLIGVFHYDTREDSRSCSLWVMREYGVMDSWSKFCRIDQRERVGTALGFRNNGEILLEINDSSGGDHRELASYDYKTHTYKQLGLCGAKKSFYVGTYTASLILLNNPNCYDVNPYKGVMKHLMTSSSFKSPQIGNQLLHPPHFGFQQASISGSNHAQHFVSNVNGTARFAPSHVPRTTTQEDVVSNARQGLFLLERSTFNQLPFQSQVALLKTRYGIATASSHPPPLRTTSAPPNLDIQPPPPKIQKSQNQQNP